MPKHKLFMSDGGGHVVPSFLGIIYIACTILRFPVGGGRITEPFHNMLINCNSLDIILPLRTTTAYSVK
jgi:hypothetical protein